MDKNPDYELLKDGYAIIDGIPDNAISFGVPRKIVGKSLADGTVCSPEGWLSLHPIFIERGLSMGEDGTFLRWRGIAGSVEAAMAQVFRIPEEEAAQLFGDREVFASKDATDLSDKTVWEERVRRYLHGKAQLTPAEVTLDTPLLDIPPGNQAGAASEQPRA